MTNERASIESSSLYLEQQQHRHQQLLNEGINSGRNEVSTSGGGNNNNNNNNNNHNHNGIPNDDTQVSYRLNDSGFERISPSPPVSYSGRSRPHSAWNDEGSSDWRSKSSSSYRVRSDGSHYQRNHNSVNGVYYRRMNNDYNRSYSTHSARTVEENDLYFYEDSKDKGKGHIRSSSLPSSTIGSNFLSFYGSSSQNTTRISQNRSSTFNGIKNNTEVPLLISSGLSVEQETRVRKCLQNSTNSSENGTKVKILELLQYWMSDRVTATAIELLIIEAFREAGIKDSNNTNMEGNHNQSKSTDITNSMVTSPEIYYDREKQKPNNFDRSSSPSSSSSSSSSSVNSLLHNSGRSFRKGKEARNKQQQNQEQKIEELKEKLNKNNEKKDATTRTPENQTLYPEYSTDAQSKAIKKSQTLSIKNSPYNLTLGLNFPLSSQTPTNKLATYDDIPRFYFPKGPPRTKEEFLIGPTSKKHENPHLKLVEGMILPAAVSSTYEDRATVIPSDAPTGPKVKSVPIAPLKAVEDKDVPYFIQKEFSRLPAPPRPNQNMRSLSSHSKGFLGINNISQTRHGINYKLQLTQAIQRICTQCFGLPKYFAFLIIKILQADADKGNIGVKSVQSKNSMILSTSSLVLGSSGISHINISAHQLRELFEIHLRGRCILRRIFEIFILSSRIISGNSKLTIGSKNALKVSSDLEQQQQQQIEKERNQEQRSYLLPEDFRAYIEVLLEYHPGLAFLKQTPDFQSKYLDTVIYRIFYDLDRFNRGYITYTEMECSCFLDSIRQVDATDDINSVLLYFSYEHFYVLYCRFWELDEDRDMLLSLKDFLKYAPDGVMNPIIAERIFNGAGRPKSCTIKNKINYEDFVWFCLSEEDKSTPTAIRYWFRILDLDGDGILSLYELENFYLATRETVLTHVPDGAVSFEDVMCQVFDMFAMEAPAGIRLKDLLSNPEAAGVALNMITNVVRFLQFEQKDPFVAHQDRLLGGPEQTPWDRFARAEYDRMSQEVGSE